MKKLYKNIILFLLPIFILLVFLPVDKKLKYQGLGGDCLSHGIWMYQRIFENEKPVDLAFLGSSHTISAIDDQLLEEGLIVKNIQVLNLGYCRLGRNLHYTILRELVEEKKPKYLILEVREQEDRYSHPIFPYLANSKDVLLPEPFFNRDILDDAYTHLSYKVELSQDFLYQNTTAAFVPAKGDFGYGTTNDTTDIQLMESAKISRSIPKPASSDFHMKYPRAYLQKIITLCQKYQIEIHFLYLPSYGTYLAQPTEYETYIKYGKVLIPPQEIFDKTDNWYDTNHLNPAGTLALSNWLLEEIQNTIIFD